MSALLSVLAASLLMFPGCGAIFTSGQATVRIDSDPQGADVTIDGMPMGKTPLVTRVSNRQDHVVQFHMSGQAASTCVLTSSVGAGYVILDVLFTGLIGVIIDVATNGWTELDQDGCFTRLGPAQGPTMSPAPVSMSIERQRAVAL